MHGSRPDPAKARVGLEAMLVAGVEILTSPEAEIFVRFIMREQTAPTEAFTIIYDGVIRPLFDRVELLLQMASAVQLEPQDLKLRTTMLVGQLLHFRVCRATVLRNMGWSDIGPSERALILKAARNTLEAVLSHDDSPSDYREPSA
jgi:hypothetical protein